MSDRVDIGDVTRGSGLPTSTLHVWERAGLLDPIGRDGLRRQYDAEVFQRLATIVLLQRGGFTLEEIRELLEPDPTGASRQRFAAKLEELQERRRHLDAAIDGIEHALACTEPVPTACPAFLAMLDGVLPVDRGST
ncbi:MAG: MerR family transcriptional regulator [Acidimicrobiia bacterium]|nr:MerR family transcriptional regulator [Acidimicrobiia bacterium]